MAKESTLTLTIKVDDQGSIVLDKFSKSAIKASEDIKRISSSMQVVSVAAFINIAQQAINAAERVYSFSRAIATAGMDIEKMSRVFNMTTDDFQRWSFATKMADVDMEGFGRGFKFLTRSMSEALQGTGDAAKAFEILGINLKDATGRTKDQQTVMMEVIGTLEKYADGVNRDAIMLTIFGRSWMSFKPMIDQGTKAIEANRQEAERLNLIIGKDMIKSLTESEDSFKRWEATWRVSKMRTFTPLIEIFTNILERILSIKRALAEGGIAGAIKDILAAQEEARIEALPPAGWTKEWVTQFKPPPAMPKPEAPVISGKEQIDSQKKSLEELAKAYGITANELLRIRQAIYDGIMDTEHFIEGLPDLMVPLVSEMDIAIQKQYEYQDAVEYGAEVLNDYTQAELEVAKAYGITVDELRRIREALDGGIKDNEHFIDSLKKVPDILEAWKDLGDTMASAMASNFINMIKGAEDWKDAMLNIIYSVADAALSTMLQMGIKAGIGAIGGWLSPTAATVTPATGPPPPAIGGMIPVEGMGAGGGGQTIIYINAADADSVANLFRRNSGVLTRIVESDLRGYGSLTKAIKGL